MRDKDRWKVRRKLDAEMRPFRMALRVKTPTAALLRTVRQAMDVRAVEVAEVLRVSKSEVNRLERSEENGSITMRALSRMADAMGCEVVYGIVPKGGRTMESLAEMKMWQKLLEAEQEGTTKSAAEEREA